MQRVTDKILNWYSFWVWNRAQKFIEANSSSIIHSRQQYDKYVQNVKKDSSGMGILYDARYLREAQIEEMHLKISEAKLKMYEAQRDYHKLIINRQ